MPPLHFSFCFTFPIVYICLFICIFYLLHVPATIFKLKIIISCCWHKCVSLLCQMAWFSYWNLHHYFYAGLKPSSFYFLSYTLFNLGYLSQNLWKIYFLSTGRYDDYFPNHYHPGWKKTKTNVYLLCIKSLIKQC